MDNKFYVTGIGASAGGLDALKSFFKNIAADINASFVIVQHLAISQKGYLQDILKKVTEIPIEEIKGKTKIKKGNIYLIPPQSFLIITDGYISLKKRDPEQKINNAIDIFFKTLGEKWEDHAVGIILSGLGTDGSLGVQKIKEKGGVIMVQDPNTATFANMPFGAIFSDHPDYIDSPEELALHLSKYTQSGQIIKKDQELEQSDQLKSINKILSRVSQYSGINFHDYKSNTILRRIDKRIKVNHLYSLEDYVKLLEKKPEEIQALYANFLIGVTEFFRDADSFQTLQEKVIPEMCKNTNELQTLRIWVTACSTGEEAYSIAILLNDYIERNNLDIEFKIFATDLSQKAINIAGRGQFTEQIESQVPENLLTKYFTKKGEFYEVIKEIRKMIIFSVHNVLNDPPFIRLDLLACRNLFIYLKEEVQLKLLYTFNYSLNNGGYLFLGANETEGDMPEIFERLDIHSKLYRNKISSKRFRNEYMGSFDYQKFMPRDHIYLPKSRSTIQIQQERYAEILVEKYAPICLILSEGYDILYTSGKIEKYLKFPNKRSELNIFEMVSGNTSLAIRNGLNQLKTSETDIFIKNVNGFVQDPLKQVDLRFFQKYDLGSNLVVVEFQGSEKKPSAKQLIEVPSQGLIKEVERLETELYQSRKELQFNADELEAINEELQSSNEEMKSSNEEMQTTNEELQATNEELKTVNFELQSKIEEITVLHNDVNNLFVSTQIGTLFLDGELLIRKYTPAVQRYFNIREGDIGRPIDHYSFNFSYDHFIEDLKSVLKTLQPVKKDIKDKRGFSVIKIIPYKTEDMRIDGVIITFTDITEIKENYEKLTRLTQDLKNRTTQLEQSEKHWKSLVENSPDVIARLDKTGEVLFVNETAHKLLGKKPEVVLKNNLMKGGYDVSDFEITEKVKQVIKTNKTVNFYQISLKEDPQKSFYITLLPEWNLESKTVKSALLIARDISELRQAEKSVESKSRRLEELNQYMDNFVHAVAHDLRSPITNLKLILELIEDENDPRKKDLLIFKFRSSVSKIDDILNGLIEIVDTQKKAAEKAKPIDIPSIIQKTLDTLPYDIPKNAQVHMNLNVKNIRYIGGYLQSILRNILSNSVKYASQKRPLNLNISTFQDNEYTLFEIEDNGIGMDIEQVRLDLFKPFKRFNHEIEGKGIGLHIIKSMIEKTGGRIEVESEKDRGTKFLVYLQEQ